MRAFFTQDFFFLFSLPLEIIELLDGWLENLEGLLLEEAERDGIFSVSMQDSFGNPTGSASNSWDLFEFMLPTEDFGNDLADGEHDLEGGSPG